MDFNSNHSEETKQSDEQAPSYQGFRGALSKTHRQEIPNQHPTEDVSIQNGSYSTSLVETQKPINAYSSNQCQRLDCKLNELQQQNGIVPRNNHQSLQLCDQNQSFLQTSDAPFVDSTFQAVPESITNNFEKYPIAKEAVWKRIPEIYTQKKLSVCSEQMGPNDIIQGRLGDCFFLSALSALAEQKHYIRRLFHSTEISKNGCYSIWLNDSGEWKSITVDDLIPCTYKGDKLAPRFSKVSGNDIWVILLEKAYAKLYGSYFAIGIGYQGEALCALTGAPFKYLELKKNGVEPSDQIWQFVSECLKKKFVITASSRKESEELNNKGMGIVSGHAYAVLDAREVLLADGQTEKIIKMRNPWGNREWNGRWGDTCPQWTDELKGLLSYQPTLVDGVFWICLADFCKYFRQKVVCKIHSDFGYSAIKLGQNQKQSVFIAKMKVKKTGLAYITVHQKRQKHFIGVPAYDYSNMRVILAKTDEEGQIISIVHGKYKNQPNIVIRRNLEEGNYMVFIDANWIQDLHNEVTLSAYSEMDVEFQEEPISNYDVSEVYARILRTYIVTSGDPKIRKTQLKNKGELSQTWKQTLGTKYGLSGSVFINQETDKELRYKIIPKEVNNMIIYVPQVGDSSPFDIVVPPGEERVLLFKAVMETGAMKIFGHKYSESHIFVKATPRGLPKQLNGLDKDNKVTKDDLSIAKNSLVHGEVRKRTQGATLTEQNDSANVRPKNKLKGNVNSSSNYKLLDEPKRENKSELEKNSQMYIMVAIIVFFVFYKVLSPK